MNNELFLTELAKAMSVDGRVNVDAYSRVVRLIDDYKSINNSVNTHVSGSLPPMSEIEAVANKIEIGQNQTADYKDGIELGFIMGATFIIKKVAGGNDH